MNRILWLPLFCVVLGCSAEKTQSPKGSGHAVPTASPPPLNAENDEVWPTEEEVKAALHKVEYDIRASETNKAVWKVTDCKHAFDSIKFGQRTVRKQMTVGGPIETCYPVKVLYTRTTEYQTKAPVVEKAGVDVTWFFYRDSFGAWTCRAGTE